MNHPMPRASRRTLVGMLAAAPLVAGGVLAAGTAQAGGSGTPEGLRRSGALDDLIAQLAEEGTFSGTVRVVHQNRTILSRSVGEADRERHTANGPDTIFGLGSITKVFTGVAIARLVQDGTITYRDKIGTYLDGLDADIAADTTVHHLLTHTSGLGDYMQTDGFWDGPPTWDSAEEAWDGCLAAAFRDVRTFTPGAKFQYSNTGYFLLGAIVAAASGRSYHDYVREHVFAAAGMDSADFYTTTQWAEDDRIARPYSLQPSGERVNEVANFLYLGGPDGGAFANAPDLVRFVKALRGNQLLDAAHTDLVVSPKAPNPPLPAVDGKPALTPFSTYAPDATLMNGSWFLGHNGGAPGLSANFEWYPDSDWTVVTLANFGERATGPIDTLIRGILTAG